MVEKIFHKITASEIKAAVTRDMIVGDFDINCGSSDIDFRTVCATTKEATQALSENDFLSTADLRETQLFDLDNRILGVAPESL